MKLIEYESGYFANSMDDLHKIDMVAVNGGSFHMGDVFGDGFNDEQPICEVKVESFYIAKFPVTQGLWSSVMGYNNSCFSYGRDYPVERVSWDETVVFIDKINKELNKCYRLPTEAEWEYAARSEGGKQKWPGTNNHAEIEAFAWFSDNSSQQTHLVGQKKPNELGLYDMAGNVWEWCQNDYAPYDMNEAIKHGKGKVMRGGSWRRNEKYLRTVERGHMQADFRLNCLGFRLAHSTVL